MAEGLAACGLEIRSELVVKQPASRAKRGPMWADGPVLFAC
jgi:hypothetical protein